MVRIYLFPEYVTLRSVVPLSPQLFEFLSNLGVQLEVCYTWDGTLESLPKEPAIIRASTQTSCLWEELGKRCAELGHFCFYNDNFVRENGVLSNCDLIDEIEKFLKNQQASLNTPSNGEEIDLPPFDESLIRTNGI